MSLPSVDSHGLEFNGQSSMEDLNAGLCNLAVYGLVAEMIFGGLWAGDFAISMFVGIVYLLLMCVLFYFLRPIVVVPALYFVPASIIGILVLLLTVQIPDRAQLDKKPWSPNASTYDANPQPDWPWLK